MKTKEQKRNEARERHEANSSRSVKQRLAELDRKLGKGVGARSERARLAKLAKSVA